MKINYEIVIAHYNEDLEWIKPYSKNVIIYHKGNETKPRFPVKKWIKLENVGREGETYLYHIINNYDKLSDITIFFQGGVSDHYEQLLVYKNIEDYLKEAKKYGFSSSRLRFLIKKEPQIIFYGKFKEMYESGKLKKAEKTFANFYNEIFGSEQPYILPFFFAANFAVTKEKIHDRPVKFYEEIHKYFVDHSNPEEGHYLERLWFTVFNPKLSLHYFLKIIKNPFISLYLSFKRRFLG